LVKVGLCISVNGWARSLSSCRRLRLLLIQTNINRDNSPRMARAPITPPTIAPDGVWEDGTEGGLGSGLEDKEACSSVVRELTKNQSMARGIPLGVPLCITTSSCSPGVREERLNNIW